MLPYPLTNFEIQKFFQNKPKFNGTYSRNILPKIKVEAYVMGLCQYELIGTYWIAFYANTENLTCFDSFGLEHIPK